MTSRDKKKKEKNIKQKQKEPTERNKHIIQKIPTFEKDKKIITYLTNKAKEKKQKQKKNTQNGGDPISRQKIETHSSEIEREETQCIHKLLSEFFPLLFYFSDEINE